MTSSIVLYYIIIPISSIRLNVLWIFVSVCVCVWMFSPVVNVCRHVFVRYCKRDDSRSNIYEKKVFEVNWLTGSNVLKWLRILYGVWIGSLCKKVMFRNKNGLDELFKSGFLIKIGLQEPFFWVFLTKFY